MKQNIFMVYNEKSGATKCVHPTNEQNPRIFYDVLYILYMAKNFLNYI